MGRGKGKQSAGDIIRQGVVKIVLAVVLVIVVFWLMKHIGTPLLNKQLGKAFQPILNPVKTTTP
ncbi:MAG: hypothetical protein ACOYOU_05575 [Kiritimatiellia bacterium]